MRPRITDDQRKTFDWLRANFDSWAAVPMSFLECKLLKLANSFESPPASEWAGLEMGGCVERIVPLSKLNDMQEIAQIRGPATESFCGLAERAGNALPAWIEDCPVLFDDFRVGISGPSPVVNRDGLARWVGFVFATLKQHQHQALQISWKTPMGPVAHGLATLDRDLCAASVLAIDLGVTGLPLARN